MATRFYMYGTGASLVQPAASALWTTSSTNNAYREMRTSKGNSTTLQTVSYGVSMAQNTNHKVQSWVSGPLTAQTIPAGTLKAYHLVQESSAAADMISQLVVKVVSNDGTTLRGYLYAGDAGTTLTSEWPAAYANRAFPRFALYPVATSSLAVSDGDRIVVEWGVKKLGATTASYTASIRSNDTSADRPEDETTTSTAFSNWIELSVDVSLYATVGTSFASSWTSNATVTSDFRQASISGSSVSSAISEVAWTDDNNFVALSLNSSPYVAWYQRDSYTSFTRLSSPASLPSGLANSVAWSPGGAFLAVATSITPYIHLYQRSGTTLTKLSDPGTLPTGAAQAVAWSSDGAYLAVGHATTPFITIYSVSGTTFTKISNPATLPPGQVNGLSWNSNTHLAYSSAITPFIRMYSVSGGVFTSNNVDTAPGTAGTGHVAFSPNGSYLVATHGTSSGSYIYVYTRSGNSLSKMNNLSPTLPSGSAFSAVAFTPDSTKVLGATNSTEPFIQWFSVTGGTFAKASPQPEGLYSPISLNSVKWAPDGKNIAIADSSSNITFYHVGWPTTWTEAAAPTQTNLAGQADGTSSASATIEKLSPKTETLTDDFTTKDTGKWTWNGTSGVSGGKLVLSPVGGLDGINANAAYDITDSYVMVKVEVTPGGAFTSNLYLGIHNGAVWPAYYAVHLNLTRLYDGTYNLHSTYGFSTTSITGFNFAANPWLRIANIGSDVLWQYSADGVTWTTARTVAEGTVAFPSTGYPFISTDDSPSATGNWQLDKFNLIPAGGTTKDEAGSSAGTSTASATVSRTRALAASSAGTSTASAAATRVRNLAGASAGTSTASATVEVQTVKELSGASAGTSTFTNPHPVGIPIWVELPAIERTSDVAGSSAGTSTALATLEKIVSLVDVSGTTGGTSSATASIQVTKDLGGSAEGTSSALAAIMWSHLGELGGMAFGISSASASISIFRNVAGSSSGSSSASANVAIDRELSGTAAGTSSAGATLNRTVDLSGTASGLSGASATVVRVYALSGQTAGSSTASAAILRGRSIAGSSAGTSSAAGTVRLFKDLSGESVGSSTASATIERIHPITRARPVGVGTNLDKVGVGTNTGPTATATNTAPVGVGQGG